MRSYKSSGYGDYSANSLPRHNSYSKPSYAPTTRYNSNYNLGLSSSLYKNPLDYASPSRSISYSSGLSGQSSTNSYHTPYESKYRGSSVNPSYSSSAYSNTSKTSGNYNYSSRRDEPSENSKLYGSVSDALSNISNSRSLYNSIPRKSSCEGHRRINPYSGILKGERNSIDSTGNDENEVKKRNSISPDNSIRKARLSNQTDDDSSLKFERNGIDKSYQKYLLGADKAGDQPSESDESDNLNAVDVLDKNLASKLNRNNESGSECSTNEIQSVSEAESEDSSYVDKTTFGSHLILKPIATKNDQDEFEILLDVTRMESVEYAKFPEDKSVEFSIKASQILLRLTKREQFGHAKLPDDEYCDFSIVAATGFSEDSVDESEYENSEVEVSGEFHKIESEEEVQSDSGDENKRELNDCNISVCSPWTDFDATFVEGEEESGDDNQKTAVLETKPPLWGDFDQICIDDKSNQDECEIMSNDEQLADATNTGSSGSVRSSTDNDADYKYSISAPIAAPPSVWEQFCSFDAFTDDGLEGETDNHEPHSNSEPPPWEQFCADLSSTRRRFSIQVQPETESESEEVSEQISSKRKYKSKKPAHTALLSLPADSALETSASEYDSEAEFTTGHHEAFTFFPTTAEGEERGRVQDHLAIPAPIFNIKVTYDSDVPDEESVASVSDYEDLSGESLSEEEAGEMPEEPDVIVPKMLITSMDSSIIEASEAQEFPMTMRESAYDADISRPVSIISDSDNIMYASADSTTAAKLIEPIETSLRKEQQVSQEDVSINSEIFIDAPTLATVSQIEHSEENFRVISSPELAMAAESKEPKKFESLEAITPLSVAQVNYETLPTERAERFFAQDRSRRPNLDNAMVRTAKGVSEVAKQDYVIVRSAPAHVESMESQANDIPLIEYEFKEPEMYSTDEKVSSIDITPAYVKEQQERVNFDRPDWYRPKKPTENWAKKSIIQPYKKEKIVVSTPKLLVDKALLSKVTEDAVLSKYAKHKAMSKGKPNVEESVGPSFEEQMEDLRQKIKYGSSNLSQQMKDLSKGISSATANTKLATEQENYKDLMNETTNLRQSVNKNLERWKGDQQEDNIRREKKLDVIAEKQAQKTKSRMAAKITKLDLDNDNSYKRRQKNSVDIETPLIDIEIRQETEDVQGKEAKQRPSAFGGRRPHKVESPFVAKDQTIKQSSISPGSAIIPLQELSENKSQIEREKLVDKVKLIEKPVNLEKILKVEDKVVKAAKAESENSERFAGLLKVLKHEKEEKEAEKIAQEKHTEMQNELQAQLDDAQAQSKPILATSQIRKPEILQTEVQKRVIQKADLVEPAQAPVSKTKGEGQKARIDPTKLLIGSQDAALINNKPYSAKKLEGEKLRPEIKLATKDAKFQKHKPCFKCKHRHNKFIGQVQDIDEILTGGKENNRKRTFDQLELLFSNCSADKRPPVRKISITNRKNKETKVYIWDIKNVDDLYNTRDLQMILAPSSPVSKSAAFTVFKPTQQTGLNKKVDDCALQLYKGYDNGQSDYGSYLDSDLSLSEQPDELAALKEGKKTSLVLRTQLSARVKTIKDKLKNSRGKDLRRALFSLKQIFQDDKDLVHEFVQNDGLSCLIQVNSEVDQTYQNYILRALGQVMLYVDGMNGVIAHNETIQWLYSLLGSPFRLVAKTALKLLLVFVEYTESNSLLLLAAVYIVDKDRNSPPWSYLMHILNDRENNDMEIFVYAMSLVSKTLNGIPDQDTYYDVVDALEEQGMEETVKRLSRHQNKELASQCRLYEWMLSQEDSDWNDFASSTIAKMRRLSPKVRHFSGDGKVGRRQQAIERPAKDDYHVSDKQHQARRDSGKGSAPKFVPKPGPEKEEISAKWARSRLDDDMPSRDSFDFKPESPPPIRKAPLDIPYKKHSIESSQLQMEEDQYSSKCPPPKLPDFLAQDLESPGGPRTPLSPDQRTVTPFGQKRPSLGAVHSLPEKMGADPKLKQAAQDVDEPATFADALGKARRGMEKKLAAQQPLECRKESEIQWEKAMENLNRPLIINNLDFTELEDNDDSDPLWIPANRSGIGTPNPSMPNGFPAPPPLPGGPAPPPFPVGAAPPPPSAAFLSASPTMSRSQSPNNPASANKDMRTVRLFWKEAQVQPTSGIMDSKGVFWQNVKPVDIDPTKVVQLFETKVSKDVVVKKKEDKKHQLLVLDTKRSNAINIGLTKLPPMRAIKTAILKFDSTVLNKECIEKILHTMMPTEEEKERIIGAQMENPGVPLGTAEQFLMLLAEIPVLFPRLKLWLFMLDYANAEKEVAEPLMDLKLAMEELEQCRTFKYVMGTLLAVGNVLNGAEIKGFQLDFLAKVPEIKDTVYKHSLVFHLCSIVMEKFGDSTDLYSELGAAVRCARVDFDEVAQNLDKMERECKASWDYLRMLAKQESSPHNLNKKIGEFLSDCAQRIMTLKVIHRRVINRFRKFLLYMGIPQHAVRDTKVNATCKTITEFALEYRTCREKINQQKKRQMDKRERNKTRGKLITENLSSASNLNAKGASDSPVITSKSRKQHEELSRVLKAAPAQNDDAGAGSGAGWMSFPGVRLRHRQHPISAGPNLGQDTPESADDELIDGLVKAATVKSEVPKDQKRRARQFNRKSLRRTRTLKLVDDEAGGEGR